MTTPQQIQVLERKLDELQQFKRDLYKRLDFIGQEEIRYHKQILNLQLSCPPTLAPSATSATPTNK